MSIFFGKKRSVNSEVIEIIGGSQPKLINLKIHSLGLLLGLNPKRRRPMLKVPRTNIYKAYRVYVLDRGRLNIVDTSVQAARRKAANMYSVPIERVIMLCVEFLDEVGKKRSKFP